MKDDHRAFSVVAMVMIVVSVVGIFMGLSLTAQMIANIPETETLTTRADSLLGCRSACIDRCIEEGMDFEHGRFYEDGYCECFCF